MDEFKIRTSFFKKLIGKVLNRKIKKSIGWDISTEINKFEIESTPDGKYRFYVDVVGEIDKAELERLLSDLFK